MTTVNQYRVYCNDEATDVATVWDVTAPTVCPNNGAHTIQSFILDSVSAETVQALEPTEGYFETTTVTMTIPAGTPGTVTEHDVTWPWIYCCGIPISHRQMI